MLKWPLSFHLGANESSTYEQSLQSLNIHVCKSYTLTANRWSTKPSPDSPLPSQPHRAISISQLCKDRLRRPFHISCMDELQNRWNLHFRSVRTTIVVVVVETEITSGRQVTPETTNREIPCWKTQARTRPWKLLIDCFFTVNYVAPVYTEPLPAMNARKEAKVRCLSIELRSSFGTEDNEMIHAGRTPLHQYVKHCSKIIWQLIWFFEKLLTTKFWPHISWI